MSSNGRTEGIFITNSGMRNGAPIPEDMERYAGIAHDLGLRVTFCTMSLDVTGRAYEGSYSVYISGGNSGLTNEEAEKLYWTKLRKSFWRK